MWCKISKRNFQIKTIKVFMKRVNSHGGGGWWFAYPFRTRNFRLILLSESARLPADLTCLPVHSWEGTKRSKEMASFWIIVNCCHGLLCLSKQIWCSTVYAIFFESTQDTRISCRLPWKIPSSKWLVMGMRGKKKEKKKKWILKHAWLLCSSGIKSRPKDMDFMSQWKWENSATLD